MEQKDFVKELDYLGFTMRIKRISDALIHGGRKLYNTLDLDIEPNWYVIFKLLKAKGGLSITQIAEQIKIAHPSVITIINKMMDKGYLISEKDPKDSRKRIIDLSERAIKMLPEFEEIWGKGEKGLEELMEGLNILDTITSLESIFLETGFEKQMLKKINKAEI